MGAPHERAARELALEAHGIFRDVAAASVLCFGPLVYDKRGLRFDHVARHAELGEVSRLVVHQLAGAKLAETAIRAVTSIENVPPFLDYVDALVERGCNDELVLCSSGQASWAVVALLRLVAPLAVPIRHAGDLDRTGVLILRSLTTRVGTPIEPLCM